MANPLRGEADLEIGSKKVTVTIDMSALIAISKAIDVRTFSDMASAVFVIENMPKVVRATLDAAGVKEVSDADINAMDWGQYMGPLLDALLRRKSTDDTEADPPKGQRKRS